MKDSTVAFLVAVGVLSSLSELNRLIRSHPVWASYAVFLVIIGSLLMYLGFNAHIVF